MIFSYLRIQIAVILFFLLSSIGKSQVILSNQDNPNRKVTATKFIQFKPGFKVTAQNGTFYHAFIDSYGDGIPEGGDTTGDGIVEGNTMHFSDTKGELSITDLGNANYTLPISLPPGIKGIAPQLALVYNSASDNGMVGYGWNIKGISSVSRVSSRLDIDGFIGGVKLNSNDKFSLDGQRLILDKGNYGAAGSTYKTENLSNLQIEAVGEISSPGIEGTYPEYFKVTFPDGIQVFYGSSSDSRGITEWLIKRWKDPQGNYVEYFYDKDKNTNYISRIVYAVNENVNTQYYNTVRFFYKRRDRTEFAYIQGIKLVNDRILNKVEVSTAGKLFRKYQVNYETITGNYQRVTSLQEFNGANEPANPIIFTYKDTSNSFGEYTYDKSEALRELKHINLTGDFDGDGEVDVIASGLMYRGLMSNLGKTNDRNSVNYDGFLITHPISTVTNGKLNNFQSIASYKDESPAGISNINDHRYETENKLLISVYDFNKNNNNFQKTYVKKINYPYRNKSRDECFDIVTGGNRIVYETAIKKEFLEGDFNGDGISELLIFGEGIYGLTKAIYTNRDPKLPPLMEIPRCEYETSNFYASVYYVDMNPDIPDENSYKKLSPYFFTYSSDKFVVDIDGDGKSDILSFHGKYFYVSFLNKNKEFEVLFSGEIPEYEKDKSLLIGDFNGDGKSDLMIPEKEGSSVWFMYISTGKGFEKVRYDNFVEYKPSWKGRPSANRRRYKKYRALDLNKDGKSDFIESEYESWTKEPRNRDGRGYIRYFENIGGGNNGENPVFRAKMESEVRSGDGYSNPITLIIADYKNNEKTGNYVFVQENEIWRGVFNKDLRKDLLLTKVTEVKGNISSVIEYSSLEPNEANNGLGNVNGLYFSSNQENYPYKEITRIPNMDVVSKLSVTTKGKTLYQRFKYFGLTTHTRGLGLLGFKKIARSNWMTDENIVKTSIWSVEEMYPQLGRDGNLFSPLISSWTFKGDNYHLIANPEDNQLLSKSSSRFLTDEPLPGIHSVLLNYQIEKDFINGTTITTDNQYHDHHNLTQSIVNNGTGTIQTNYTYINNPSGTGADYYIGRLVQKTEKSTAYNDVYTTEEKYFYTNNLITRTQKKGHNTDYITEDMLYDNFGNVIQKTVSAPGVSSRTIKDVYDVTGRFVVQKTDADNLTEYFSYNNLGQILSHISPFQVSTYTKYDDWGKLQKTVIKGASSTPSVSYTAYQRGIEGEAEITFINEQTGEYSSIYKDILGRDIKTVTKGFADGEYISKHTIYDVLGRKIKESEPSIFNSLLWNTIEYDELSRPIKQTLFTGKEITTSYNGLSATTSDGVKKQTITKDANGNTVKVIDNGETITYTYYANGNQKTSNYKGHIITTKQDGWGRKIELQDPSVSTMPYTYSYNNYGELLTETTPDGTTSFTYSPTGRVLTKTISGNNTDIQSTYQYSDKGLLLKETGTSNGENYSYSYTYDNMYRLSSQKEMTPQASYLKEFTYDQWGRELIEKTTTTFRNLTSSISVKNDYNSYNGIRDKVIEVGTGKILWQVTGMNERMQVLSAKLGNNIAITNQIDAAGFMRQIAHTGNMSTPLSLNYDFNWKRGTLNSRYNQYYNWNEQFTYDSFDRLVSWSDPNGVNTNQYAPDGRITNNSQVGEYQYDSSARYKKTSINLNTIGKSYYENRPTQQITYNVFKNPVDVTEGSDKIHFDYNPHNTRARAEISSSQPEVITKYYSDTKEVEIFSTASFGSEEVKIISYISGSPYDAPLIFISRFSGSGGNLSKTEDAFYYLHRDYQGTILAISNEQGQTIERRLFDPWGKIIKVTDKNGNTQSVNPQFTFIDRGYTGHEHFFTVGLIHMNGRMYDSVLKQFLSPDNNIQEPFNSQNYNRYGYVLNNPLMYTDPSGEIFGLDIILSGAIIGAFIGGATYTVYALYTDTFSWSGFTKSILTGGATGALGGVASLYAPIGILPGAGYGATTGGVIGIFGAAISGGDIVKGGLLGAVTGGIMGGVMGGIEAHKLGGNIWTGYREPHEQIATSPNVVSGNTPVKPDIEEVIKIKTKNISVSESGYPRGEKWGLNAVTMKVPKGYTFRDGYFINNTTGAKALAVTVPSIWGHGSSNIHFATAAFASKEQLTSTFFHEMGHVIHIKLGLSQLADVPGAGIGFDNYGHAAIYKMQYNLLKMNGWLNKGLNGFGNGVDRYLLGASNEIAEQYPKLYNSIKILERIIKF